MVTYSTNKFYITESDVERIEMDDKVKQQRIDNLAPFTLNKMPPERRKEIAKMGGKAQAKAKTARRAARDVLLDLLASDSTDKDVAEIVKNKGLATTEQSTLLYNIMKKAGKSANMAELLFRLTGDLEDKPTQNITIVGGLSDEQLLAERQKLLSNDGIINITPEPPEIE